MIATKTKEENRKVIEEDVYLEDSFEEEVAEEPEEIETVEEDKNFEETVKVVTKLASKSTGKAAGMNDIRIYLNEIGRYGNLSTEEEIELGKRMSEGDISARDELVKHNLRFVISIAKRYTSQGFTDFNELISLGNIGLITAIEKYDWKAGVRVTTYAARWIKNSIEEGIQQVRNPIAKPKHVIDAMKAVSVATKNLESVLQREPSSVEISDAMDGRFTPEQVDEIIQMMRNSSTVSLDTPIGSEEDGVIGDMLCDNNSATPEEEYESNDQMRILHKAIDDLKPVHKKIIKMRYGFGCEGDKPKSLDEIADVLYQDGFRNRKGGRFSKEYVRQLEEAAIEELQESEILKICRSN